MKEIAQQAWGWVNAGRERALSNKALFRGYELRLIRRTAKSKPEMLLARLDDEATAKYGWLQVVAFPRSEHFPAFEEAGRGVERGGPSGENRGGIGTMQSRKPHPEVRPRLLKEINAEHPAFDSDFFYLVYAQAHYKTGRTPPALSRTLATKYGGWFYHAFSETTRACGKLGASLVVDLNANWVTNPRKREFVRKQVTGFCDKLGLDYAAGKRFIIVKPGKAA